MCLGRIAGRREEGYTKGLADRTRECRGVEPFAPPARTLKAPETPRGGLRPLPRPTPVMHMQCHAARGAGPGGRGLEQWACGCRRRGRMRDSPRPAGGLSATGAAARRDPPTAPRQLAPAPARRGAPPPVLWRRRRPAPGHGAARHALAAKVSATQWHARVAPHPPNPHPPPHPTPTLTPLHPLLHPPPHPILDPFFEASAPSPGCLLVCPSPVPPRCATLVAPTQHFFMNTSPTPPLPALASLPPASALVSPLVTISSLHSFSLPFPPCLPFHHHLTYPCYAVRVGVFGLCGRGRLLFRSDDDDEEVGCGHSESE